MKRKIVTVKKMIPQSWYSDEEDEDFLFQYQFIAENHQTKEKPPEKTEVECTICLFEHEEVEGIYLNCGHFCCKEGIESYVQECVNNNELIKCPHKECDTHIMSYEVESCVCKGLFAKLEQLDLNKALNSNVINCPTPDCKNCFFIDNLQGRKEIVCEQCFCFFCSECKENFHHDVDCKEYKLKEAVWKDELELIQVKNNAYKRNGVSSDKKVSTKEQYLRDELWKEQNCRHCPHCNHLIEKTEGCSHMRCGSDNPYSTSKMTMTQNGCGKKFQWDQALPYKCNRVEKKVNPKEKELADRYQRLRVIDLKPMLKERKMLVSGTKQTLIQRLIANDMRDEPIVPTIMCQTPNCANKKCVAKYKCLNCKEAYLCDKCILLELEAEHKNHIFDVLDVPPSTKFIIPSLP